MRLDSFKAGFVFFGRVIKVQSCVQLVDDASEVPKRCIENLTVSLIESAIASRLELQCRLERRLEKLQQQSKARSGRKGTSLALRLSSMLSYSILTGTMLTPMLSISLEVL